MKRRQILRPLPGDRQGASGEEEPPTRSRNGFDVGSNGFSRPAFAFAFLVAVTGFKELALIVGFYFILQFFYSYRLKHIVILDIFIVAAGFMMRVVAGAEVIGCDDSIGL